MIREKECENKDCSKKFYGTKRAKFCCGNCRLISWRSKMDGQLLYENAEQWPDDEPEPAVPQTDCSLCGETCELTGTIVDNAPVKICKDCEAQRET